MKLAAKITGLALLLACVQVLRAINQGLSRCGGRYDERIN